jgi:hypothetical protein
MVTAAPAFFRSKRPEAIYGSALHIDPTLNCDGLAQAETRQAAQERLIAWHRDQLIEELTQLRRGHRSTLATLTDLREATHAILSIGAP